MTVQVTERLSQLYVGNGVNTRFDFTFRAFQQEDSDGVSVRVRIGSEFELMDRSKYNVNINPDNMGGYVLFNDPPNSETYFYVSGDTSLDQLLDITNYDNFYPDALEKALDKLTAILQEWSSALGLESVSRKEALNILQSNVYAMLEEAIANGTVSALAITTVDTVDGLLDLNTWAGRTVEVLDFLQNGKFKFNPARENEYDGGTIFFGWERIDFDTINFNMFGADRLGVEPVDSKILAAFNASRLLKKPIHNFSGKYKLSGSDIIQVAETTLLDGSEFVPTSEYSGYFVIQRETEINIYEESSAIVQLIKTGGILHEGDCKWGVIANDKTLNDQYLTIYSTQPMFVYRGNLQTRFMMNRCLKNGQMKSPLFYDLDLSTINKIKAQKIHDYPIIVSGFCFDETNTNSTNLLKGLSTNSVYVRNLRYKDYSESRTAIQTRLSILDCHNFYIDTINTSSVYINNNSDSSYTVFAGECYELVLDKIVSDGTGWGAIGFNNCQRVEFKNSQLNRIDFHLPCHEWLKIESCTIGNWGILVTMMGDLYVINTRCLQRDAYNNSGIIRSRSDTGGFCNGDLFWINSTIDGYTPITMPLISCQGSFTPPAGSPVRAEIFTNVYIDGLKKRSKTPFLTGLISTPTTIASVENKLPKRIEVKGFVTEVDEQALNLNFSRFSNRTEGVVVEYHNVKINNLQFNDMNAVGTPVEILLDNVRGIDRSVRTSLTVTANAEVNINNSKLMKYREYSGGWSPFLPIVRFNGGLLHNPIDTTYFDVQNPSKDRIVAVGTDFRPGNQSQFLADLLYFTPKSCTFNNARYMPLFTGDGTGSTYSFTLAAYGSIRILVRTGFDGGANYVEQQKDIWIAGAGVYNLQVGTVTVTIASNVATITVDATSLRIVGLIS
ncbi:hypothetical protein [Acinetobacter calcoaceticus]|uniref:hypothetical protein n=1 Tax=Acinetobacter calcoaceticus TaxID=471 RepID=UPI0002CEF611|nr:hypothetical protein [Acinetobacter calcoaceticus]ENU07736.1 hypothetical protein F997_03599 [Acinetobacter calcoaceticus NIPH 13]